MKWQKTKAQKFEDFISGNIWSRRAELICWTSYWGWCV